MAATTRPVVGSVLGCAGLSNGSVISTDATSALIQPEKIEGKQHEACKKGHFFTAVVDVDHVLFAYAERHTQELP